MRRYLVLLALTAASLGISRTAAAQGFQVNEHGTCAMARAGTGVAKPCTDGSAMFFNPAGLIGNKGWTLSAGATVISAFGGFTDDLTSTKTDLANSAIPVPHAYVQYAQDKWAAGVGMFVPYGLGTKWPQTFAGAFAGYDNDLRNIYVQPTVAFRPHPMITIGAGFDVVFGHVKLTQVVDLSENPVPGFGATTFGQLGVPALTAFANGELTGSGTGYGFHGGITFEPTERLHIGARYMSRVKLTYDGNVVFTPVSTGITLPGGNPFSVPAGTPLDSVVAGAFVDGPLLNQPGGAAITLPDQISAGVAVDVTPALTILADYSYVHWKLFDTLQVNFENTALSSTTIENYKDTHGVRVGIDWAANDKANVRGGYIFHTGAAPATTVTPLLPEGERNEFTIGFGYAFMPQFRVDAAYQYLKQANRRGRTGEFPSGAEPTLDLNNGLYEFKAHLFGLTLTVGF
ncbi:MAG: outer membrane protein transport protein [Gemmatimonadota bacterium]|nr:outer membrane protein transport protein [Gemmatimonadota bacterium]MDH5198661.1 outer membrane protein transport protein [Gemmatimonadota bacterium]